MIRLRYVLVAVIALALAPWTLDGLPSLACAIPAVDCADDSFATVSDRDIAPSQSVAGGALLKSPETQPTGNVALPPPVANGAASRQPPAQASSANPCCARNAMPLAPADGISFMATRGFGGLVTIKWRVAKETGFEYYLLDRKLRAASDDTFERQVAQQPVDGSLEYSWTDTPPSDAYTYRLRALAAIDPNDGGTTLATADVDVDYVIGVAVGEFAVGAASGLVSVNWTAAEEAGVVSYVLDRKRNGAASYDLNVDVGYPQGDGTQYSLYDDPHGTGSFIYRLRATLSNGTHRILVERDITL